MAKSGTKTKTMQKQHGWASGVRDEKVTGAPIHVSSDAQAKENGKNTRHQLDFTSKNRKDVLVRPRTSGGPASSSSSKESLDKRRTRDDLYINPLALHGRDSKFYNLPLPSSQSSLDPMPRSSSLDHAVFPSTAARLAPESAAGRSIRMMVDEELIGMAIGSPTQQPAGWQPQQPQGRYEVLVTSPGSVNTASVEPAVSSTTLKRKPSKWKKLGGLFGGKKNAEPQVPFYQVQPETMSQTSQVMSANSSAAFATSSEKTEMKRAKSRGRSRTISDRKVDVRPDMKRSNTIPVDLDPVPSTQEGMKVQSTQTARDTETVQNAHLVGSQKQKFDQSLLLNVEIPKTELERYSIMFGSVLQSGTGETSSSSLLARRQATLERLKTEKVIIEKEKEKLHRPRRATSPQPTKSPGLSLFPGTPAHLSVREHDHLPHRPSPLQRSNTSPAALSPSRPTFALQQQGNSGKAFPTRSTSREAAIAQIYIPKLKVRGRDDIPKPANTAQMSFEESRFPIPSPDSGDDAEYKDNHMAVPAITKPVLHEPAWQMVTSSNTSNGAPSISGSMTSRSDTSASKSSTSSSATTQRSISSVATHASRVRSPTSSEAHQPANKEAQSASRKHSEVSPLNASRSGTAPVSRKADASEKDERRLLAGAQVSIARKVSVSRGQRQLIVPVKGSTSPPATGINAMNPNFPSPLNMKHVGSLLTEDASKNLNARTKTDSDGHIIAGSKSLTPTLVVVGGREEKPRGRTVAKHASDESLAVERNTGQGEASHMDLQFRRSERVLIERIPSN
ncbi:hypothetical protein B7463_g12445, partial [Scytalidium lignicola]